MKADIRFLAATSMDIEQMIRDGKFRSDLFDRLNVIGIGIPPLRKRKDDIPLLVAHFMGGMERIGDGVLDRLSEYDWPGNVRELKSVVERLSILSGDGVISEHDFEKYSGIAAGTGQRRSGDFGELYGRISALEGEVEALKSAASLPIPAPHREEDNSPLYRMRRYVEIEDIRDEGGSVIFSHNAFSAKAHLHPGTFLHRPHWTLAEMINYTSSGIKSSKNGNSSMHFEG